MTRSATSRTSDASVNPLRLAAAAPVAAAGRIQRFAVMAQSATGRTAPQ